MLDNPTQNIRRDRNIEEDHLIEVSGLSKKFCKDLKTSLYYGVKDLLTSYKDSTSSILRPKEFWAVKNVSFKLKRGECLGLIGHNGAGKSTLLKMLNGLINPDEGRVKMKGRVGALIELGAGFNPILSGRENIYNNGAILGFSKKEIDQKLSYIIDFAELKEFIDMPVRNYSSGMKVRLGFAVAAQMNPDILIIDEVLAVGDLGFVLKCFKTIDDILPKTAVIFVAHSMPMVSRICSQIMLLENGHVKYQGNNVSEGIDIYYTRFADNDANIVLNDGRIAFDSMVMHSDCYKEGVQCLNWGDDLNLTCNFEVLEKKAKSVKVVLTLSDKEQRPVAVLDNEAVELNNNPNCVLNFSTKNIQLSKGVYSINITVNLDGSPCYRVNSLLVFQVLHHKETWHPFMLKTEVTSN